MRIHRSVVWLTLFFFFLTATAGGAWPNPGPQPQSGNEDIGRLLKEADQAYQNGDFKAAIEKYQRAMELLNDKKELAKTKAELVQAMTSLALTYFTIQENAKAEKQLEDLIALNPNQELDPEFYSPKFVELFQSVQGRFLGRLTITTVPAEAEIFINDARAGKSPLTLAKYLKGKYDVRAELKGYLAASATIDVLAGAENKQEILLQAEKEKIIEPPAASTATPAAAPAAKKKKSALPWIIAGGAIAGGLIVLMMMAKKKAVEKMVTISNEDIIPIVPFDTAHTMIEVNVNKKINRLECSATIEHPSWQNLKVALAREGNPTVLFLWNQQSFDGLKTVEAESHAFDGQNSTGRWFLSVENDGIRFGAIRKFELRIFYLE